LRVDPLDDDVDELEPFFDLELLFELRLRDEADDLAGFDEPDDLADFDADARDLPGSLPFERPFRDDAEPRFLAGSSSSSSGSCSSSSSGASSSSYDASSCSSS
jgi:hypothetical protein